MPEPTIPPSPLRKTTRFILWSLVGFFLLTAVWHGRLPANSLPQVPTRAGLQTRIFDGIEITGSDAFLGQVTQALQLMKTKAPPAYAVVTRYVGKICQAPRSGMKANLNPPTFELADPSAFYSITWCAGAIAHDSFHSKLYHDYPQKPWEFGPPAAVWTGAEAEKKCSRHQYDVLKKMDAPPHELNHCRKEEMDGKYFQTDYEHRNW